MSSKRQSPRSERPSRHADHPGRPGRPGLPKLRTRRARQAGIPAWIPAPIRPYRFDRLGLTLTALVSLCACAAGAASARSGGELGAVIGEPTGVSFAAWTGPTTALNIAAAWSLENTDVMHLHADYVRHTFGIFDIEEGSLSFYWGIGGRGEFRPGDDRLGARLPLGLNYFFESAPLSVFGEIAPTLDVTPETTVDVNGGVGIRVAF